MAEEIMQRVVKVTVSKLGVNETEVVPSASFQDDLGADSLDLVELVMGFEEEFNVQIPDDQVTSIRTVQDAADYIQKNVA